MARPCRFDIQPGQVLKRYSEQESTAMADAWMKVFGQKPAPHLNQHMWHVFSYAVYPSQDHQAALDAYSQVESPAYCILANDRKQALLTDRKPTSCTLSDYYVFPENLAWTMAFTHEDGWLGPYFARHPRFERLNAENVQRILQMRQAS